MIDSEYQSYRSCYSAMAKLHSIIFFISLSVLCAFKCFAIPSGIFTGYYPVSGSGYNIFPADGARLNYRLVGFIFPTDASVTTTSFSIASGYFNSPDSFRKNIITTLPNVRSRTIAEVPEWGHDYTWQVVTYTGYAQRFSKLYHFTTGSATATDTSVMRLRILKEAAAYKNAYVFSDCNKALYDMQGHVVWYLPDIEGKIRPDSWVRDLQMSPEGTITFLLDDKRAYEISYNGDVLWKGPENEADGNYVYHHQFNKIPDGHFMALTAETRYWRYKQKKNGDKALYEFTDSAHATDDYQQYAFEKLVEYDGDGKVIWQWRLLDYLKGSDLIAYKPEKGKPAFDVRVNAFYFDKARSVVYLSFKNNSRIIKIKYPEGKVIATYGETFGSGTQAKNDLFCHQHNCRVSQKGYLYVFNNGCDISQSPKVTVMQEPVSGKGRLSKVWEYECNADDSKQMAMSAAGSAFELPDNSFFVSMGTPYSKIFIVNRNKEIIWSALPEKWNATEKKWRVNPQYKASIIEDKTEMEKLIFNRL